MAAAGFADEKALEYPYNPPSWVEYGRDAILAEPFRHKQGSIRVPDKPGLGFEVDMRALRKYGRRTFVMDKKRLIWFALRDRGLRAAREIDAIKRQKSEFMIPQA